MREWCDAVLAFLLAPSCGACGAPLHHPTRGCICQDCWQAIPITPLPDGNRAGDGTRDGGSAVERALAIGPHAGALRDVIHALKYDGRRSVARPLARLMSTAGADLLARADAAVPVPLHPSRRRSRGFNQAADLARHIGLPVVHALARTRHTDTQTALPAAQRRANVEGAFRPTRRAAALRGASVLLIDDVRTTGATLEACAVALKQAGVARVSALTAARVETPGP